METELAYTAWINRKEGIVSFHPVEGWERHDLPDRDSFLAFAGMIVDQHFKIQ